MPASPSSPSDCEHRHARASAGVAVDGQRQARGRARLGRRQAQQDADQVGVGRVVAPASSRARLRATAGDRVCASPAARASPWSSGVEQPSRRVRRRARTRAAGAARPGPPSCPPRRSGASAARRIASRASGDFHASGDAKTSTTLLARGDRVLLDGPPQQQRDVRVVARRRRGAAAARRSAAPSAGRQPLRRAGELAADARRRRRVAASSARRRRDRRRDLVLVAEEADRPAADVAGCGAPAVSLGERLVEAAADVQRPQRFQRELVVLALEHQLRAAAEIDLRVAAVGQDAAGLADEPVVRAATAARPARRVDSFASRGPAYGFVPFAAMR